MMQIYNKKVSESVVRPACSNTLSQNQPAEQHVECYQMTDIIVITSLPTDKYFAKVGLQHLFISDSPLTYAYPSIMRSLLPLRR